MANKGIYPRAIARREAVRAAFDESGLKQTWLARRIGLDRTYVNLILNGHKHCQTWIAEDIARLLNKPVGELFEIVERPPVAEAA